MAGEMHIRPVTTVTDHETGELVLDVFRYDGETIVIPVAAGAAARRQNPHPPRSSSSASRLRRPSPCGHRLRNQPRRRATSGRWKLMEKEIQREIGRYTDGFVDVQMTSDTKAVVYIDDKDVPAAIGKGGKNVSAIVNKIGIGIDIKPRSEFDRQQASPGLTRSSNLGGGIKILTDKKQLTIQAPEQSGRIVDVFAGKEYSSRQP